MKKDLDDFLESVRATDRAPASLREKHLRLVQTALTQALPSDQNPAQRDQASAPQPPKSSGLSNSWPTAAKGVALSKPVLIAVALATGYVGAKVTSPEPTQIAVPTNAEQPHHATTTTRDVVEDSGVSIAVPPQIHNIETSRAASSATHTREEIVRAANPTPEVEQTPTVASPPTTDQSMVEQVQMIRAIESAVRANNFAAAFELLQRHEQLYPTGPLVEERNALRVIAQCRAETPSAARAAAEFLERTPQTAMRRRIEAACPSR